MVIGLDGGIVAPDFFICASIAGGIATSLVDVTFHKPTLPCLAKAAPLLTSRHVHESNNIEANFMAHSPLKRGKFGTPYIYTLVADSWQKAQANSATAETSKRLRPFSLAPKSAASARAPACQQCYYPSPAFLSHQCWLSRPSDQPAQVQSSP